MKKCPYCAEEIQDEAIVCRFCGKDLVNIKSFPSKKPRQMSSIFYGAIIGAIISTISLVDQILRGSPSENIIFSLFSNLIFYSLVASLTVALIRSITTKSGLVTPSLAIFILLIIGSVLIIFTIRNYSSSHPSAKVVPTAIFHYITPTPIVQYVTAVQQSQVNSTTSTDYHGDVCSWLLNATIIRASRISAAEEWITWNQKYVTSENSELDDSSIDELKEIIGRQIAVHKRFVESWIKLGPHDDTVDLWTSELRSANLRLDYFKRLLTYIDHSTLYYFEIESINLRASLVGNKAEREIIALKNICNQ